MDLLGLSEVAELAGVSRQAVVNWRTRFRDFPQPAAELASGPVWERADIEKWLRRREGSVVGNFITGITGSGKIEDHNVGIADFDRVEISNAIKAEIVHSDTFRVTVTADDNLFDHVDVSKSGSTLRVRLRPSWSFFHITAKVYVSMPLLRGVKATGACRALVSGFRSSEKLDMVASGASMLKLEDMMAGDTDIDVSGASRITGKLDMANGHIEASGASTVDLSGSGKNLRVKASGASSAKLGEFKAQDVDISLNGASNGSVNMNGRLDADLSGASHLNYAGQVSLGKLQVTGASGLTNRGYSAPAPPSPPPPPQPPV